MTFLDNNKIFVSIAIATYNGGKFLQEQLNSLLNQTYKNIEIVVSDDGSTDNTQLILKEYEKKDKRIRWSVNPNPQGFIKNFERAISLCSGEIIFLCDQDDIWYKDKIFSHLVAYKEPTIMWVYNEVRLIGGEFSQTEKFPSLLTDSLPDYYSKERKKLLYYVWGSCILGCATSYRSYVIKDIWPADSRAPGHDSWIQLAIFPAKSFHIPTVLQDYRQHEGNTVGVTSELKGEGFKKREQQAIQGNMHYLRNLVVNSRLSFWKRSFFLLAYTAKIVRSRVKKSF